MDKRKSILNVSVSMGFKITTVIVSIVVKRALIQICGNETNGLNTLYLSIIGFLAVAELGIGSAISFCMYKPIVLGQTEKVAALHHLFRRIYLVVGAIILAAGLAITPFLRYFVKDYAQVAVDFRLTFLLMLVSVVITYLFAAETALINAYKNNYITTAISSGCMLLQQFLQIAVLKLTGSFEGYLACRIVTALVQWIVTELVARGRYSDCIYLKSKLDEETRTEVSKNIKAMFMHKIGHLLAYTVDNVVISAFVGVIALGSYSNYSMIQTAMLSILTLGFTSLTSVLGHLYVQKDLETSKMYAEAFHMLNFIMGMVFFLGYYAVADNLVAIFFGAELVAEKWMPMVIALNGFVQFLRQSTMIFRDATGTFYYDRWKSFAEGIVNVTLSILFVRWIGVIGVIVATIITNVLICHIVEPFVLYRHAFQSSPARYYVQNYSMMLVFVIALFAMDGVMCTSAVGWKGFFLNGTTSVGISAACIAMVLAANSKRIGRILRLVKEQ